MVKVPSEVRTRLSDEDLVEIERILWRRRARSGGQSAERSPSEPLSLDEIRDCLLAEFSERGLDADSEPTTYGRRVDALLGRLPLDPPDEV